jgi:hypothetical protein
MKRYQGRCRVLQPRAQVAAHVASGSGCGATDSCYTGSISTVLVYNRALTDAERHAIQVTEHPHVSERVCVTIASTSR